MLKAAGRLLQRKAECENAFWLNWGLLMPDRMNRLPLLAVGTLFAVLHAYAHAIQPTLMPPAELASKIATAVKFTARKQQLAIDPAIVAEMTADAGNFVGNFCGSYVHKGVDPCESTVEDAAALRELVNAFILDAFAFAPTTKTLASRMADRAGVAMANAGWPSERANNVGMLIVPSALRSADLSLRTASGNVPLGQGLKKILIRPGKHIIVAAIEQGVTQPVRVQVEARRTGEWEYGAATETIAGRIEASLKHYCPKEDTKRYPATYGHDEGRAMISRSQEERIGHLIPAAVQGGLDIRIRDETGRCDKDCLAGLGYAFAEAVAVWRSGCSRCDMNALAVLRIGTRVWLERRAVARVLDLAEKMTPPGLSPVGNDYPLFGMRPGEDRLRPMHVLDLGKPFVNEAPRLLPPSLSVPLGVIFAYEQIDQDAMLVAALCKVTDAASVSWVLVAQSFLCQGAPAASLTLRPVLVIRNVETDCGPGAIACAIGGGRIQLDTSNFRYAIATPTGKRILGSSSANAAQPIGHVIIHEVGHWFGIPHPEQVGVPIIDVMSGVMHPERECVTAHSLTMLNNAADDRWPYRAKGLQGLHPPGAQQRHMSQSSERK